MRVKSVIAWVIHSSEMTDKFSFIQFDFESNDGEYLTESVKALGSLSKGLSYEFPIPNNLSIIAIETGHDSLDDRT